MTKDTAPRLATSADLSGNTSRPRQWPRLLGGFFVVLGGALVLAWLSFPAWAPLLAQRFVPENWTVLELDVRRPGFTGLEIRMLEARGIEAGLPMTLQGNNINVRYAGPDIHIQSLALRLAKSATTGNEQPFDPAGFSIPRLAVPTTLPGIRIDILTLADEREPDGQRA